MSGKPKNRPPQPKPVVPRALPEIQAENENYCSQAGKLQYQIFVFERDLARLNDAILGLNYEAAERQKLDKAAEPKQEEEEAQV